VPDWRLEPGRSAHAEAVRKVRAAIAEGRTYQVNLTARLRARHDGDPLALWDRMRRAQGAGYHAYLDTGRHVVASASPELFFRADGRRITTRPMKGTRPRGRWPAEDAALEAALRASAKDRAENLMIVDLLRNDVGRVARSGTVRVPRLLDVERYRTVWQLTSTVTGELREDVGLVDLFRALFPCGSVTGAPKISTMGLIAELEDLPREVYCGAIGVVRPGGDCVFSVPIRTVWIDRGRGVAEFGTGGGVVWDSTPASEYRELLAKSVVVRERWPAFQLLETLRLEAGGYVRLERHLARLRASAAYFDRPFPDDEIRAALAALARSAAETPRRVRIAVSESGEVVVTDEPLTEPVGEDGPASSGIGVPSRPPIGTVAGPPPRYALAGQPVSSRDRFLFHKTTHRQAYDRARIGAPADAFDVLLHNERGEITEFTRGNLVIELDGRRVTPPVESGLLAGCLRQELLDSGSIEERAVTLADLERAPRTWFINSLRGWVPVEPLAAHVLHASAPPARPTPADPGR
jgi:para-aminobenzoate synthetase/4-amino-4-deoxychorismate lyase